MIQLDPQTGKRLTLDSPLYSLAHHDSIEAPFIYRHGTHYYLFVNWGTCCRGTNSTYEIRVGRADGVRGPYLDRAGKDLMSGGATLVLGAEDVFIGPGHAGIWHENGKYWFSFHFYNGSQRGMPTYAMPRSPDLHACANAVLADTCVLAGGDDYELVFTAPPDRRAAVEAAGRAAAVAVTRIGRMITGAPEVRLLDAAGKPRRVERLGFDHFR